MSAVRGGPACPACPATSWYGLAASPRRRYPRRLLGRGVARPALRPGKWSVVGVQWPWGTFYANPPRASAGQRGAAQGSAGPAPPPREATSRQATARLGRHGPKGGATFLLSFFFSGQRSGTSPQPCPPQPARDKQTAERNSMPPSSLGRISISFRGLAWRGWQAGGRPRATNGVSPIELLAEAACGGASGPDRLEGGSVETNTQKLPFPPSPREPPALCTMR